MSAITKEFTKEQLQQIIETDHVQCGEASSLARIALASHEAEAVGTFKKGPCGYHPSFHEDAVPLYTAPPAPVSVPDGYRLQPISEYDAMCAAMLQGADGNSPVIPDGWVACSERMPDDDDFVYIWPRPDFGVELHVGQYCECHPKGDGWYAQVYEQNYGIEWCPITVTHWMPLPAAPQQEVTQALAKGMERYGDAMQKLADSGD
ncbi:DUF551 domain-containing protein [Enterobacter chengduensis]